MYIDSIKKLNQWQKECRTAAEEHKKKVLVCLGPGCLASGSDQILAEFNKVLKDKKLKGITVESVKKTGCHGFCARGPLVVIEPEGIFYSKVKKGDVAKIVEQTLQKGELINRLLYTDDKHKEPIVEYKEIPFYKRQQKISLRNVGRIDPDKITDYIAEGGYSALAKVLGNLKPKEVIDTVSKSGIRGRGGGGFGTGRKWASCASIESDIRYVICNGDEGDPGAFMDRCIMEGDPHTVLEGMIICAYAIGSTEGYIYVREEYPLAVISLQKAIEAAREHNLLGDNVMGTGFKFDIRISRGGGAFVCGESSALMRSVAGEVGEPRAKYIRSVQKGLHDKPTVLNNVETFATIPVIMEKGADWFASIGTRKSTGTKAFSLAGKVKNTGLIEVPMGITLREIIYEIGGGIDKNRDFKAVQTGGPSGGCLPAEKLDLQVDFDTLTEAGSMMGSGGMIVMDSRTCMVDVARYFLNFLVEESCGKCVPCREGLYQLHDLCVRICEGKAEEDDLVLMERLSKVIQSASLCGLGQSGPNPFVSTIMYFRDEYLAHIRDKKCLGGICRSLIRFDITDACTGCLACIAVCPVDAITGEKKKKHIIDQDLCTQCGSCYDICNYDAIEIN
ncbi:MAG: NADH-quinone oxidoreductase subunit F [candidate division Zixibacteria bacterium HGW-Zixibacteria-1]|nr:MAG: NADH-quinone oxidoreductase subunit F [candidate division Zixibacteria bacterium HGW-Zixibacteria-1]